MNKFENQWIMFHEINKLRREGKMPYAGRMMRLRSSTVEPVLGTLINFTGMRRIYTAELNVRTNLCCAPALHTT